MSWIHVVLDAPPEAHDPWGHFWAQALGWSVGQPWPGHPELRSFEPPAGDAYVHLQRIAGPARIHLDVESQDPQADVARATASGALLVREHEEWTTLESPGGLPFCVLQEKPRQAPGPTSWPGGHGSRMVQVCLDSPADRHDREVLFWRTFLSDRWVDSSSREFAGTWHDDAGSPVQLLLQRLDEPTGEVRAHLDLGTDDVPAETQRLLQLGATDVGPGREWHTLRDPAGVLFCVTGNSPGQLRSGVSARSARAGPPHPPARG